jgi:hypothetical protein
MTTKDVATRVTDPATEEADKPLKEKLVEGAEQKAKEIASATGKPVTIRWVFNGSGFFGWLEKISRFPSRPGPTTVNPPNP